MENSKFLKTRFELFGLLFGDGVSAGRTQDHEEDVVLEQGYAKEITLTGSKSMQPLFDGAVTHVTLQDEDERYVIRVWYDEYHYKSFVVSPVTTAKGVCAMIAGKFNLERFSFALFMLVDEKKLVCFKDTDRIGERMDEIKGQGAASVRMVVLRPPVCSENLRLREKVLIRWLNYVLSPRKITIRDLRADLSDGVVFVHLVELLCGKDRLPHHESPKSKQEKRENIQAAFELFKSFGIIVPGDPVKEVCDQNLSGIMRVIWSILFRSCTLNNTLCSGYQAQPNEATELVFLEQLLNWAGDRTSSFYDVEINDFSHNTWADGLALAALLEGTDGYAISYIKMQQIESASERLAAVLQKAVDAFHIPPLLTAKEFTKKPDDLTIAIYIATMAMSLVSNVKKKAARSSIVQAYDGIPFVSARLYFEGLPDCRDKLFKLERGTTAGQLRAIVAERMSVSGNDFWIYFNEGGYEQLAQETEQVLSPDKSIIIKMVSGSDYYGGNDEQLSPRKTRALSVRSKKKRLSINFRRLSLSGSSDSSGKRD